MLPPGITSAPLNKETVICAVTLYKACREATEEPQVTLTSITHFCNAAWEMEGKHMWQNIMSIYERNSHGWPMARVLTHFIKKSPGKPEKWISCISWDVAQKTLYAGHIGMESWHKICKNAWDTYSDQAWTITTEDRAPNIIHIITAESRM